MFSSRDLRKPQRQSSNALWLYSKNSVSSSCRPTKSGLLCRVCVCRSVCICVCVCVWATRIWDRTLLLLVSSLSLLLLSRLFLESALLFQKCCYDTAHACSGTANRTVLPCSLRLRCIVCGHYGTYLRGTLHMLACCKHQSSDVHVYRRYHTCFSRVGFLSSYSFPAPCLPRMK